MRCQLIIPQVFVWTLSRPPTMPLLIFQHLTKSRPWTKRLTAFTLWNQGLSLQTYFARAEETASQFKNVTHRYQRQDSAVSIATGYRVDSHGVGFRVPLGTSIFTSPYHLVRLWGPSKPPNQLVLRTRSPASKATGAWSWLLTSN
jgi:hypothetical protein